MPYLPPQVVDPSVVCDLFPRGLLPVQVDRVGRPRVNHSAPEHSHKRVWRIPYKPRTCLTSAIILCSLETQQQPRLTMDTLTTDTPSMLTEMWQEGTPSEDKMTLDQMPPEVQWLAAVVTLTVAVIALAGNAYVILVIYK